jgi:hypothetical protein
MNKTIEEMIGITQKAVGGCAEYWARLIAEELYNAGYRKTFTSEFASPTQKAYKEGYGKGFEDGRRWRNEKQEKQGL